MFDLELNIIYSKAGIIPWAKQTPVVVAVLKHSQTNDTSKREFWPLACTAVVPLSFFQIFIEKMNPRGPTGSTHATVFTSST